jgi:hypothetical protein
VGCRRLRRCAARGPPPRGCRPPFAGPHRGARTGRGARVERRSHRHSASPRQGTRRAAASRRGCPRSPS